jgi:hypothetical protein
MNWNLARAKLVAYRDMDRTFLLACCKDGSSRRPVASRLRATAKKKVQIEGTNLIENLVWIAQDPYMAVETLMDILETGSLDLESLLDADCFSSRR